MYPRSLPYLCRRTTIVSLAFAFSVAASAAGVTAVPGVENFHKLDDHVYRGAQPTDEGFLSLAKMGIRTVIDLQQPGDRGAAEAAAVASAGMKYINIPMNGMETPSAASVAKVLALLEDISTGPVFVHCHRGADRTGGVIACYRIEHDHWENKKALSEARSLGMSWYQKAIQNYVKEFHPKALNVPTTNVAAAEVAPAPGVSALVAAQ